MATYTEQDLLKIPDQAKLTSFQLGIMMICFVVVALDGFDTQSIAFVAPALRESWGVSPALFGPLFGAGLFGTMVGSIVLGSVADRYGRKPLLLISTGLFGIMSLLCATATSIETLGIYRFTAGLGLGGAIPNVLSLISEYSPRRVRSTVIVITFTGFPLGAVFGGIASARIIPQFGWESVFILGGILPLVLLPVIFIGVPESLRYLTMRKNPQDRIRKILVRIEPGLGDLNLEQVASGMDTYKRIPVKSLFTQNRANWTILLWLLTFTTLLLAYFLVNWTPLVLVDAGIPHSKAILGVVALNLGGVIGSIIIGRISDRSGPFVPLGLAYGVGAVFVAAVGIMIQAETTILLSLIFTVGLCVFGAQLNISAISANYYPVSMRSTGIGWNMGVGRLGSIIGPTVGGALVAYGLARGQLFLCAAAPAAIACLLVIIMSFNVPAGTDTPNQSQ